MKVSLVVAVARNDVIGRDDGSIPWRVRTDIRHYRELTMGHPIVMGRKTHESIGKPLPGRLNIVLTRDPAFTADGCIVVHDPVEALRRARDDGAAQTFVIGGGNVYDVMLPYVSTMYITRIDATPDGEAHFRFDESQWIQKASEYHPADLEAEDEHSFRFITYVRNGDALAFA